MKIKNSDICSKAKPSPKTQIVAALISLVSKPKDKPPSIPPSVNT